MNFRKVELINIIEKNRDNHQAIFEEALEGYKREVIKSLEDHLERVKSGSVKRVYVSFPEPVNHTRDYDRILSMLEMTPDDTIPLSEKQFAQYIQDDWDWKRQFLSTNSALPNRSSLYAL